MKRNLLLVLLACLTATAVRADLIWYEGFNYADGSLTNNSAGVWINHNGNPDAAVSGGKLQNGSGAYSLAGDVHRDFCSDVCDYTNTPMVLYASFTVNSTNFPDADGGYFAHFYASSTTFQGRVFAVRQADSLANTWQLGVSAAGGTASAVFPADLATNVDYQVVIEWDPVSLFATTLWVNPVSAADPKVTSSDTVTPATVNAFGFRQATGFGNWYSTISNLVVATTFDEAATNVWNTNAVAPIIAYEPVSGTNFVGETALVSAVAAGQGLGSMVYEWYKNGAPFANPSGTSTNALVFASAVVADSGNYQLVATTPYGLSVTSQIVSLWVTNPPLPATITQQPTNTTVFFGQTATLRVGATGVQPISFQWFFADGTPVSGLNFSGEFTDTLMIADVRTNNGTTGGYYCDATNPFGTKHSATGIVSAVSIPLVTIAYLRTLVDPVFFLPTNTTAIWSARGIVTTHSRLTGGANTSFYFQDDTAGMGVFIAGGASLMPEAGDDITVTGPLSAFNGGLQFNLNANNASTFIVTNSQNNPLPAGTVLPLSFTNGVDFGGVSNVFARIVGSVVTFTNVYFAAAGNLFPGGNATDLITNLHGETFRLFRNSAMTNLTGLPIPSHAWTVSGVMGTFLQDPNNPNRSSGFEMFPTLYSDIVTNEPPAVEGAIVASGGDPTVTWLAQPYMSYSILAGVDVTGPYLPLVSGLTFNTTSGQYTDTNAASATRFYQILSP